MQARGASNTFFNQKIRLFAMKIVIDAVFFQLNEWSGIARYWMNIFDDFDSYCAQNNNLDIFILVRGSSLSLRNKEFKHIKIIPIQYFDPICAFSDYEELGEICKNIQADYFISTYYTLAFDICNIGCCYDFIAETMGWMDSHIWKLKKIYMNSISNCICISESTRKFANFFYPKSTIGGSTILYPSFGDIECSKVSNRDGVSLRNKYQLRFPYISVVGHRGDYKNFSILTSHLESISSPLIPINAGIVLTSGEELDSKTIDLYNKFFRYGIMRISIGSTEMPVFLHNSEILFYPSLHEGFGYPVAEALVQKCGVITTNATSISEITCLAQQNEFIQISGYSGLEALNAIIKAVNSKVQVSDKTSIKIQNTFRFETSCKIMNHIHSITSQKLTNAHFKEVLEIDGILI